VLIAHQNHPDVRLVTTGQTREGQNRTEISIDQIRQNPKKPHETPRPLIQDAYLKPALGRYKVYIIDPADRMSAEAGNALLRVLEDPPPRVVLVLVSSHPSVLLPTVVSRCQQVAFSLAGTAPIRERLEALGVASATAASLAQLSGGRPGWAIEASRQPAITQTRTALLELCADFGRQPVSASLRMAEEIRQLAAEMVRGVDLSEGEEAPDEEEATPSRGRARVVSDRGLRAELPWCLDVMASWFRDCIAAEQQSGLINADCAEAIQGAARSLSCQRAETSIDAILAAKQRIERNANIDLALECLAIQLSGGGE
jgi:DNA polymerase-3 subunit delta'